MVTQERLKELFSYDPDVGKFIRKIATARCTKVGKEAGFQMANGYRMVMVDNKSYLTHRLVWLYIHGVWPKNHIDHINGVRNDNRISNLRDIERHVNIQNQRHLRSTNKTGYAGVHFCKREKKFVASIRIDGKQKHLGYFDTAKEAGEYRLEMKRKHNKGFMG